MGDIVVFGAGQMAELARAYIDAQGSDRIVGYTVDEPFKQSDSFAGLPLVAWEHLEDRFLPDRVRIFGPFSSRRLNDFRRDRYLEGKRRGYSFISLIHAASNVLSTDVGEHAIVLAQAVIEPLATIGSNVIISSANRIGHHAIIGDHCFIAPQASIGSNANIGERTFVGTGVVIEADVSIGSASFLGSSVYIRSDLPAGSVVIAPSNSAKPYRSDRIKRYL